MRGWLLGFHLIGVVLWMGGLLMVSRVLGYYTKEPAATRPRFAWVAGRLNWLIAIPGALLTIFFGIWLTYDLGRPFFKVALWLHIKLMLVVVLAGFQVFVNVQQRKLATQSPDQQVSRGLFAAVHGIIGLVVIATILLATLKPMKG